ncbi:MAG TPA: hypothetical protein VEB40_09525 [Flavipsychrobacter sp.]|nr:hypothetical protein [Flavipsychrobacter sp.]
MKPVKSPLILSDFSVLECSYAFIVPKNSNEDFSQATFDEYPLNIDYTISELGDFVRVFMDFEINYSDEPMDGYKFNVVAASIFRFAEGTAEEEKGGWSNSMVSITINNIRSFIMNFTGGCPLGRYVFPSIDLNELVEQKRKSIDNLKKLAAPKKVVKPALKPTRKQAQRRG